MAGPFKVESKPYTMTIASKAIIAATKKDSTAGSNWIPVLIIVIIVAAATVMVNRKKKATV